MYLEQIARAICVEGTAAEDILVTVKIMGDKRIMYKGKIKDIFKEKELLSWSVLDINPNRTLKETKEYDGLPEYNLPYIITIY